MPTGRAVPKWGGLDKEQKGVSLEVSSFLKTPPLGPVEGHSVLLHVEDTSRGGEGQRKAMAGSRPLFSALGRGVNPILSPIYRRKKRRFMSPFFPLFCILHRLLLTASGSGTEQLPLLILK